MPDCIRKRVKLEFSDSLAPKGKFQDGDTFTILVPKGNTTFNIRINGIDAPERKQEFGLYSRNYLEALIDYQNADVI